METPGTPRKPWYRRPGFRISIRGLLVLVLVVGGGLGWWIYSARVQRQAVEVIHAADGDICYDWDRSGSPLPEWFNPVIEFVGEDSVCRVVEVSFFQNKLSSDTIDAISRLSSVDEISIYCPETQLTFELLKPFGNLTRLKKLAYETSDSGTSANLDFLRAIPQLEELDLNVCSAATNLVPLTRLPRLERLSLHGHTIDNDKIAILANLHQLRTLDLWETGVSGAGLAHLKGMTRLETLDLSASFVGKLDFLPPLESLKSLDLSKTRIETDDLVPLRTMTGLESLSLAGTKVDDQAVESLLKLSRLKKLDLRETFITDVGLKKLSGLRSCKTIHLSEYGTTREGRAAFMADRPDCVIEVEP